MSEEVLGNFFGNQALLRLCLPGHYLGLHESDPTPAGIAGTELAGSTRQPISFCLPGNRTVASVNAQQFSALPDCLISHLAVWDDPVAGHLMFILRQEPALHLSGVFLLPPGEVALSL